MDTDTDMDKMKKLIATVCCRDATLQARLAAYAEMLNAKTASDPIDELRTALQAAKDRGEYLTYYQPPSGYGYPSGATVTAKIVSVAKRSVVLNVVKSNQHGSFITNDRRVKRYDVLLKQQSRMHIQKIANVFDETE